MKNITLNIAKIFLLLISISFIFNSCDSDYLENELEKNQYYQSDQPILISNEPINGPITFTMEVENTNWKVIQYPQFLDISPMNGQLKNNKFSLNIQKQSTHYSEGENFEIIFNLEGVGFVKYNIIIDHNDDNGNNGNNSFLRINNKNIVIDDYGKSSIEMSTEGEESVEWKILSKPEWLTITPLSGQFYYNGYIDLKVDDHNLQNGEYTGIIKISDITNNVIHEVKVSHIVKGKFSYESGEYLASKYSQQLDELFVITKEPNQLLVYNIDKNEPTTIQLDRVPIKIACSEELNLIAISFTNSEISFYDIYNKKLVNTISTEAIPDGIVFGDNNWFYYTITKTYSSSTIKSYNFQTNETHSQNIEAEDLSNLIKVENRSVIIGSRSSVSPSGLFIIEFDNDSTFSKSYYLHNSFIYLLPSYDGKKLYTGLKDVYNLTDFEYSEWGSNNQYYIDEFHIIGKLDNSAHGYYIDALSQNIISKKIYAASLNNNIVYLDRFNNESYVKDLTIEETLEVNNNISYDFNLREIYSNKVETKSYIIITVKENWEEPTRWILKKIDLK